MYYLVSVLDTIYNTSNVLLPNGLRFAYARHAWKSQLSPQYWNYYYWVCFTSFACLHSKWYNWISILFPFASVSQTFSSFISHSCLFGVYEFQIRCARPMDVWCAKLCGMDNTVWSLIEISCDRLKTWKMFAVHFITEITNWTRIYQRLWY